MKNRKDRDALHLNHKKYDLLHEDLENSMPLKTYLKYKKGEVKGSCIDGFKNIIYTVTGD
jgi:hypothetical protein